MTTELRCNAKKHGVLLDDVIEVKCDSRFCGAKPGAIILHQFSRETGELVRTNEYREVTSHGSDHNPAAVRTA